VAHGSVSHDSCRTAHLGELTRRGKPAESLAALQLPIAPDRGSSNPGCGSIAPDRGSYPTWYLVAAGRGRSPQHADPRPRQIHDRACAWWMVGHRTLAAAAGRSRSPQIVGHRTLAASRSPQIVGHRTLAARRSPQIVGHRTLAAGPSTQIVGHRTLAAGRSPQIVGHRTLGPARASAVHHTDRRLQCARDLPACPFCLSLALPYFTHPPDVSIW
jgi:hypothetical protein